MATHNIPLSFRRTTSRHILARLYATVATAATAPAALTKINDKTLSDLLDHSPTKPTPQTYTIDLNQCSPMLLDALIKIKNEFGPTLTFRQSCREGICGSCAVNIDSCNGLACLTKIPEPKVTESTVISPLPQNKGEWKKLDGMCASCSTSWPSYWRNPDSFLGPIALLHSHRFFRGYHGPPHSPDDDMFSVMVDKEGLQLPKWLVRGRTFMLAKSLDCSMEIILHADCSMEYVVLKGVGRWRACIGHVARDPVTKEVLWFATGHCECVSEDVNEGEMCATLFAAFCARCLGFKNIIIRNDNLDAVRILNLQQATEISKGKRRPSRVKLAIFHSFQKLRNLEIVRGRENLKCEGANVDLSWIPKGTQERRVADILSKAGRTNAVFQESLAEFWDEVELDKECIPAAGRECFATRPQYKDT